MNSMFPVSNADDESRVFVYDMIGFMSSSELAANMANEVNMIRVQKVNQTIRIAEHLRNNGVEFERRVRFRVMKSVLRERLASEALAFLAAVRIFDHYKGELIVSPYPLLPVGFNFRGNRWFPLTPSFPTDW